MSSPTLSPASDVFFDRRSDDRGCVRPGQERRQFANSHDELSPPAHELATAIDGYKLMHRRRFITCEELLTVVSSLGYQQVRHGPSGTRRDDPRLVESTESPRSFGRGLSVGGMAPPAICYSSPPVVRPVATSNSKIAGTSMAAVAKP